MNDWDWDKYDYYGNIPIKETEYVPGDYCFHEWKGILLIYSTVYNCTRCGIKKEDHDKDL